MSTAPLSISRIAARRFLVRAFALDGFQTLPDVGSVLNTLGFIQEDSINVCGRIHDLILWSRVAGYTPQALHQFLYGASPRTAWEHYMPNLCVLPVDDLPYFLPTLTRNREKESRWGKLTPEEEAAANVLFNRLDTEGPLLLRDAAELGAAHGHTTSGWGTKTRLLSFVADKLFWHGRLGIARRDGFLRAFDRIERLLPTDILSASHPDEKEAAAHLARKRLYARRLFRLRAADKALLSADEITRIRIDDDKRDWYIFMSDLDLLQNAERSPVSDTVHLLAPLDPLVYDRDRTRLLWNFDYTWEVYTPAAKRKFGYYVLPILWGERLVGRIEPRLDRKTGTVTAVSTHWEEGFDPASFPAHLEERLFHLTHLL